VERHRPHRPEDALWGYARQDDERLLQTLGRMSGEHLAHLQELLCRALDDAWWRENRGEWFKEMPPTAPDSGVRRLERLNRFIHAVEAERRGVRSHVEELLRLLEERRRDEGQAPRRLVRPATPAGTPALIPTRWSPAACSSGPGTPRRCPGGRAGPR
jgi:hypothetical protein